MSARHTPEKRALIFVLTIFISFAGYGQVSRQWASYFNGQGDYNDRYTCMVTDAAGNIYLGGSTVNPDQERDYLVVKKDATGQTLWMKQFAGSSNGPDQVNAIAVDASGYVYTTGYLKQAGFSADYFTIKFNSSGDTMWTAVYNNPVANGYDESASIFVDTNGNVYVTGQSDSDPTAVINEDYATVKYNSYGVQQWVQRFNGTGNATDRAVAVFVDGSGNVVITGRSFNGVDDDYVTIKYNSSGAQQWKTVGSRGGRDRAAAMVMDTSGNVYVTGRSSNGGDDDFWTVKYNTSGGQVWQSAYDYVDNDRATAIAIDAVGNIYVTGESDEDPTTGINWDYVTLGYNTSGTTMWQKRYNSSVNQNDIPTSITAANGNVFVTGSSDADASVNIANNAVTISYASTNGIQNWIANYNGAGNWDDNGNVVVATSVGCIVAGTEGTAQGFYNALLLSYDNTGAILWNTMLDGVGNNNDNVRAIAVDINNNIYTAGYSVGNGTDRNMMLVKFNQFGALVCSKAVDGSGAASNDDVAGIQLDAIGNPIVSGFLDDAGSSNDIAWFRSGTMNCDTLWKRIYNAPSNGSDKLYDMTKDASGNFYVTGKVDMNPTFIASPDCFTAKIGNAGTILWSQTYNSAGTNEDRGSYVRIGPSGNVYVAGRTFNGIDFDILIICYNNAGAQQWVRTYNGNMGNDLPSGMVIDAQDNVFVFGKTETSLAVNDYVTLKYDAAGTQKWARTYNGTGNGNDEGLAIAFNPLYGGPVVAGNSDVDPSANDNSDMVILQYDSAGIQKWLYTYAGSAGVDDIADDIAVNAQNQVYFTGHTNKATMVSPNYDIYTAILNYDGSLLWYDIYNGTSDSNDIATLIYLKATDFYVAGNTFVTGEQRNALLIKYSGTVTGVAELNSGNGLLLYPNPAAEILNVDLQHKKIEHPQLLISDAEGRTVLCLELNPKSVNHVNVSSLKEGLYIYHVTGDHEAAYYGKFCHTSQLN